MSGRYALRVHFFPLLWDGRDGETETRCRELKLASELNKNTFVFLKAW
jgi:hypothetical protein